MKLILAPKAVKQYKKLPRKEQNKLKQKLFSLESNPYSGKPLKGELSGYYSLRVWPYRIIYTIHKHLKQIHITAILHRQGAYQ